MFYQRLFETAPQVRGLFPDAMERQKKHMTAALLLVAKNIADLEYLRGPLEQMGKTHIGYGAQEAHFPVVRDNMIAAIAEVTGDTWTDELNQDWTMALDTIAGYMIDGIRDVESKAA